MKRLFFLLFLGLNILLCGAKTVSTVGCASEASQGQVIILINLDDDASDETLSANLTDAFSEIANSVDSIEELNCTMTIKVKLSAGFASGEASITVSGSCSEVQAKAEEITRKCIAQAKKVMDEAR